VELQTPKTDFATSSLRDKQHSQMHKVQNAAVISNRLKTTAL